MCSLLRFVCCHALPLPLPLPMALSLSLSATLLSTPPLFLRCPCCSLCLSTTLLVRHPPFQNTRWAIRSLGPPGELLHQLQAYIILLRKQLREAGIAMRQRKKNETRAAAVPAKRESFGDSAISPKLYGPPTRSAKLTVSQHDGAEGRHHHRGAWCFW